MSATLLGTFVLLGVLVIVAFSLDSRVLTLGGDQEPHSTILLWGLATGLLLALPVHYVLGGRKMADQFARARDQATLDGLTGLRNHWAFQESLDHEVATSQRFGGSFTLMLADVDDFKFVNDSLGHQRGDELLVELAGALRTGRIVDRAYRIGGDEFAVIMTHTDLVGAMHAVERLQATAVRCMEGTTISIGLAEFDPASIDTDTRTDAAVLRDRADLALYEAKRRGRNEIVTFHEIAQSARMRTSAATITAVRHLLATRQMGAAFQPIWNLDTHRVIGYEGLARPAVEYGLEGPEDAFLGAARLGRIDELDALCRESVLAGVDDFPDDTLLFLNLSPEVLDHGLEAGHRLRSEVEAAGLEPHQVVIELTENASERMDLVFTPIQLLRDAGFHLALDDMGSGDTGLALLGRLRPEYVKVDRSVVCSARDGGPGRAVLAAIVAYAAESGAVVIAEGIETEEILHHLVRSAKTISRRARFIGGQGYLLGRPAAQPWRRDADLAWPLPSLV
ncbi:EAL domain-containing protein [Pengzhenrongella phosphoraccumulans]|uniref:EAL domain-containing protein n=1 Tax=Pengzhenrongella phosphoraccumulans TaxID=3114394 RepID=UPI00388F5053